MTGAQLASPPLCPASLAASEPALKVPSALRPACHPVSQSRLAMTKRYQAYTYINLLPLIMIMAVHPPNMTSLLSSLRAGLEGAVRITAFGGEDGVGTLCPHVSARNYIDGWVMLYLPLLLSVRAVRGLAAHGRDGLDFLSGAVGEVAGVGVFGEGRHGC